MKLRAKLEKLGVIDGLTHEEKGTLTLVFCGEFSPSLLY